MGTHFMESKLAMEAGSAIVIITHATRFLALHFRFFFLAMFVFTITLRVFAAAAIINPAYRK